MNRRAEFDNGPLSWVKGEIDLSMRRGLEALQALAAGDATQIKTSQAHLHQAYGALQIVGLEGVTLVSAELEALLADIERGVCQDPVAAVETAEHAFNGITAYLDALMAGAADQALRLLPLYRELRDARGGAVGTEMVEAVDLYFPDLSFRPPWRDKAPTQLHPEESVKYFRDQRTRYQRGLLSWLKGDVSGAADMRAAVEAIEQTQAGAAERAFWWALIAGFDALERGALPQDIETYGLNLRRLCNRVDAQIKRLADGTSNVDKRLLREILYCVALASPESDFIRQVQETCQLAKTIPASRGAQAPLPELSGLKPARAALAQSKEAWSRYASEPGSAAESLSEFGVIAQTLSDQAATLGNADLVALCERIAGIGARLGAEPDKMSEVVALETATVLLLVENALESLATDANSLGEAFGEQCRVLCTRLDAALAGNLLRTAPDIPLLDEMSRQAQERLVVEQLVVEMQANLQSVERVLDRFFRDPSQKQALASVGKSLHQMTGALEIIGESRACDLLAITEVAIARFAQSDYTPHQDDFEYVARTLSGLEFYIAALGRGEPADINDILPPLPAAEPSAVTMSEAAEVAVPVIDTSASSVVAAASTQRETRPAEVIVDKVDPELLDIFLEEAEEVLGNIADQLHKLRGNNADLDAFVTIRRGFHTLKGSGRMVGLNILGEAAWSVEQALNWRLQEEHPATEAVLALIEQAHRYFVDGVAKLKGGGQAEDASWLAELAGAIRGVKVPAPPPPVVLPVAEPVPDTVSPTPPVAELAESVSEDQPIGFMPPLPAGLVDEATHAATEAASDAPALPQEDVTEQTEPEHVVMLGEAAISTTVFTIFSGEAHALMGILLAEHETLKQHGIVTDEMLRAVHTLAGIAGSVQLHALSDLGHAFEHALDQLSRDTLSEEELILVGEAIEAMQVMVVSAIDLQVSAPQPGLVARLEEAAQPRANVYHADLDAILPEEEAALVREDDVIATVATAAVAVEESEEATSVAVPTVLPAELPAAAPAAAPITAPGGTRGRSQRLEDELDAQLLPLFLEEAAEIVPAVGESLRKWRGIAGDAGNNKAAFAEMGHAIERRLHTLKGSARMAGAMALGEVAHHMETRIETALAASKFAPSLFDELDNAFDRIGQLLDLLARPATDVSEAAAAAAVASKESTAINVLRARADAIDQMVNQTGEISIARSRIEGELRSLKAAMQELTDNVTRLRSQLREVEIQADSQMQAAVQAVDGQSKEGFDPLEFDRFTRFQELTRMMAESVNDVQTVHQSMIRAMDGTDAALAVQARLNRELQKDLMRVRMVAFGTLSERLHRIVRQTAKDAGKRANVDIRGAGVELDRAVLERITAPIEHVLRNAVIHGIETPEQRQALGKPVIGDIRIEVSQEGNEMRLAIFDDGAGLDLERIRAKAIQVGLLAEGTVVSEAELADFVFFPGFSTARELTQSAGRGMGMDVVRNEVAALSGRAELFAERGKGMRIIIFLPLTLAVTQVVLVRANGRLFAIPSVMVEQVMQYRPEQLAALYAVRQVEWRGRRYPLHYLPYILGSKQAKAEQKRFASVIFVRSGASAIALHVDEIVGGSQEVVVKAIGPQLQRVPGMAGATIIGSGDIVLIINPVSLAGAATAAATAAAADTAPPPLTPSPASLKMVMVVDDSLTVRKITSRLLERQGYTVVMARDGVEALEKLQEDLPDVMLVDIEMPRMDGFDLTRNVRADSRLAKVPIIMISSRTADKHRNYADEIGVSAFLGKPYQEEELLARIEECMAGQAAV